MQFCPYCMEKFVPETPVVGAPVRPRRGWLWLLIPLCVLLLWLLWLLWRWFPREGTPSHTAAVAQGGSTHATTLTDGNSPASTTRTTDGTTTTTATHTTAHTTTRTTATTASTTGDTTTTTTATTSATDPCVAGHDWAPITQTVHVDEVGHYENKTVEKRLTLFRCALCYKEFATLENYYDHFDSQHDGDSLEIVFRDRYETFAEYREVEEQTWVVDTPAYDKTITVGRRCRDCGKTETNEYKE